LSLALQLLAVAPVAAEQLVALFLRVAEQRGVTALPDGPEKEAAIQAVLAELRGQTAALDAAIAAKG
jgi:hypothetical protein